MKLNVRKTFRRRPGLNVLCTFNLRPVPTRLFIRTSIFRKSKKLFSLTSAFSWFAAYLQNRFMRRLEFSLLSNCILSYLKIQLILQLFFQRKQECCHPQKYIVRKGVPPSSLFKAPTPWPSLPAFLKSCQLAFPCFPSPPFCATPF